MFKARVVRALIVCSVSPSVTAQPIYVDNNCGNDGWCNGQSTACWNNSPTPQTCAKKSIQFGVLATTYAGQEVIVADGTYTGTNNRNIKFLPFNNGDPRHIVLRSANGAAHCIIDGQNTARLFNFDHGEGVGDQLDRQAVVGTPTDSVGIQFGKGFTMKNGNQGQGGAVRISDTNPTFRDCLFYDNNSPNDGGAAWIIKGADPLFEGCRFELNTATNNGGAVYLAVNDGLVVQATFKRCHFIRNSSDDNGGAFFITGSNGTIISESRIESNTSLDGGGGIYVTGSPGSVKLANCEIINNNVGVTGPPVGGGVLINGPTSGVITPEIMNCVFVGNYATSGGGIYISGRTRLLMANSTLAFNTITSTADGGEAVFFEGDDLTPDRANLSNSIFWRTTPAGVQIRAEREGLKIEESNIRDTPNGTVELSDNLPTNTDPLFVDADGTDGVLGTLDDNFRLQSTSPCKDTGDSLLRRPDFADLDRDCPGATCTSELTPMDKDYVARVIGTQVDMGAYEVVGSGTAACPTGTITAASPATGTRDSRRPHPQTDCGMAAREGLGDPTYPSDTDTLRLTLSNGGSPVVGASNPGCWTLCETGTEPVDTGQSCPAPSSNIVQAVVESSFGVYDIFLSRPISGTDWTRITYTHSGGNSCVAYASLAGDVDSSGVAAPADILELIDCCLNAICTPDYGDYSCDINRDGSWTSADNTELQALLNGTNKYYAWSGATLASNTCSCGSYRFAGRPGAPPDDQFDNYHFGDRLVNYLAQARPATRYEEQEFLTIVADLTRWVAQHFDADEQQYLIDELSNSKLLFASDAGEEAAQDVVASISLFISTK